MRSHFILYVADQEASTRFYSHVLDLDPILNVPGMTEFQLDRSAVLGLMPASGISRLLEDKLPAPVVGAGSAKAEIYLLVDDPAAYHSRSIGGGGRELSALQARDWGHDVAYSMDADGYVLAFARATQG